MGMTAFVTGQKQSACAWWDQGTEQHGAAFRASWAATEPSAVPHRSQAQKENPHPSAEPHKLKCGGGKKKRIIVKEMNCIKPSKRQTSNLGQFGNRILPHSDLFPQTNSAISNCCHVPQSCMFTPSSSCDFLPCLLPMITTYFLTSHCSLELWRILFERNLV